MDLSQTEELFHDLGGFAQKRFGFKKPPTLHLVSDGENASKPLGKTAYYDPQGMAVTIYTDNRHAKDILRSLAHELVHHMQNENGMLNDSGYHGQGYAQKNKDLRQSEKEAYLKGNMCFRDWEDSLKESKPTIYNEWRIKTMSTKKWKNNELMENISHKFGFKMDLSQLNEASCGSKEKYEEELKEEKECPECKGKGDECKCPDLKEEKDEKQKKFAANQPPYDEATAKDRAGSDGKHNPMKEAFGRPEVVLDKIKKADCEDLKSMQVPKDEKLKKAYDAAMKKCGSKKEGMTETKLRGVIRKLILSEMKRK